VQKIINPFLYILSFLLAAVVSIKNLREPDIWWQIRTGEWIIDHQKVPTVDVFSFTQQGQDWINIKWGFEVLAAWISKTLGPESIFIIQMLVSLLILYFIKKIGELFNLNNATLFFITTILLLFGIEYRIIGRPEMFSHLFVVVFIYLLLKYTNTQSKHIYWVIPLQIFWCNMHEAYAIGIVMLGIYTLIKWFEYAILKKSKPYEISLITGISIAAIIINPRGILLLTRPFNIFNQVQQNKYTTELDSIFTADYWHKESYFFIIIAVCFLYYLLSEFKKNKLFTFQSEFPLGYLGICMAFLFLSFTAYRNIVFFILSVIPIIAYLFYKKFKHIDKLSIPLALFGIIMYAMIVSNKYYTLTNSRDRFGLEVLSINNPSGAAQFIEQQQLKSKKGFSDYLTSSYLLWKLQPDFKTFIDLRDLDVFSTAFFEKYLDIINNPQSFYTLDQTEKFDYVVLYRKSNEALHQYLYNDSVYACTFIDAVAAVYQKTDDIPKGDIFKQGSPIPQSSFSTTLNHLFNPAYQPFDYDDVNLDYEAATYYTNVGKISLAEKRVNQYLAANPENQEAIELRNHLMQLKSSIKK
jgi:hypothetical protein